MTRLLRGCCNAFLLATLHLPGISPASAAAWGLQFDCPHTQHAALAAAMGSYLTELGIAPALYGVRRSTQGGVLGYFLTTPPGDTTTLDFHQRPEYAIPPPGNRMVTAAGQPRNVPTVSDKEIVLALMQRGRLTEFSGRACTVDALRDHVALRKNIVAWAERLEWGWPDGGAAEWNGRYWQDGNLNPGVALRTAIRDAFASQDKYRIGCYTAAKMVAVQGILDYFQRIRPSPTLLQQLEARLLANDDPLADVEPAGMWSFEADFDPREIHRPGKVLRLAQGIARDNFVPGDWVYFVNTDPASHAKTGYEGSNPIYLGRNRFADYYNDHDHSYSFHQKLDEVYQWRHGVYSRSRDGARAKPLAAADYERLSRTPADGGLLLSLRATPYYFGYEALPPLPPR